jgi:hypothetical protein
LWLTTAVVWLDVVPSPGIRDSRGENSEIQKKDRNSILEQEEDVKF